MNIIALLSALKVINKGDQWSDEIVKQYWGTYIRIYIANPLYDGYAGILQYPVSSPLVDW